MVNCKSKVSMFMTLLLCYQNMALAQTTDTEDLSNELSESNFVVSPTPITTGSVLSAEGIGIHVDRDRRAPVITLTTPKRDKGYSLLIDAYLPNKEYAKFPIQFQIFVNGQMVATQVRSPELPRAIGFDVTPDIAEAPFNYTIVATVLYPNRSFTSVAQGAVLPQIEITPTPLANATPNSNPTDNTTLTMDCTYIRETEDSTKDFELDSIETTISSNGNSYSSQVTPPNNDKSITLLELNFTSTPSTEDNLNEAEAEGTLAITTQDGSTETFNLNGTLAIDDENKIEDIELSTDELDITVTCITKNVSALNKLFS
jgi:hypothetical protein